MRTFKALTIIIISALVLASCSGKNDFNWQEELSGAIEVSKAKIDKMDIQPNGNAKGMDDTFDDALKMGNADCYYYSFEHENDDGSDYVEMFFYGGKVSSVKLYSYNCDCSEHCIKGIHIGDNGTASVESVKSQYGYFTSLLDSEYASLLDGTTNVYSFSESKKEPIELSVTVDTETDTVISVEFSDTY